MEQKPEYHHEKEIGLMQLLMRLPEQLSQLIKAEANLAKLEVRTKLADTRKYLILLASGVFIAYLGILGAIATAIIAVSLLVPLWVSALIFTLVLIIGGAVLVLAGLSRLKQMEWKPSKTIETVKENIRWLKQQRV